jgi:DNA-binding LytR/AlgR family response regulator
MPQASEELSGLRILVVEDNFLIAEELRDLFTRCGCEVIGPAARVAQGLNLMSRNDLSGAVLDINLGDEDCFPIAAALRERDVPFVFLTGYGDRGSIPPPYGEVLMLTKPVDEGRLVSAAREIFR